MTDLITSNLPESHSGRASIVVSLRAQEAYLYRGENRTAVVAQYPVVAKDTALRLVAFRSSVRTKIIAPVSMVTMLITSGRIVKANADSRRGPKPPHSHFVGTPMPYFLEFSPGYGLHQGYFPGVPASHGCIRMPYWKARQFYTAAHIGTPVVVKP